MKSVGLLLILPIAGMFVACGHKPSYSSVQVDKSGGGTIPGGPVPQSGNAAESLTPERSVSPAGGDPQPAAMPAFYDAAAGQIKDLPRYRPTRVDNLQYGPINGVDTLLMRLRTKDLFEKVAQFYDDVVRTNGWNVVSNNRDNDTYSWQLSKGDSGQGMIQVSSDPRTKSVVILLQRIERPASAKQ